MMHIIQTLLTSILSITFFHLVKYFSLEWFVYEVFTFFVLLTIMKFLIDKHK